MTSPVVGTQALPDDYGLLLEEIKGRIRSARIRALRRVNLELLAFYWSIGRTILDR